MKKNKVFQRKQAIAELIKKKPIENQISLVELLKERYNIETNQSIVSRDLHDMGIVKQKYADTLVYELPETDASKDILRLGVVNIEHNEALIVITTLPGLAAFVGDYLDAHKEHLDLLGTLAGENMVFVTPYSIKTIETCFETLCTLLYFKPHASRRRA